MSKDDSGFAVGAEYSGRMRVWIPILCALSLLANLTAQVRPELSPGAGESPRKLSAEHAQGLVYLREAEIDIEALPVPARVALTLQIADMYRKIESQRSTVLLEKAWKAANAIEDDPSLRKTLLTEVLKKSFSVAPEQAESFWLGSASELRGETVDLMVQHRLWANDPAGAIDAIEKATSDRTFPYAAATRVFEKLPPEMGMQRQQLFFSAFEFARSHEATPVFFRDDFGSLLAKVGMEMPEKQLMEAVDFLLVQAKSNKTRMSMSVSSGQTSASFGSLYEYRVFQLLPLLRKYDPERATSLVAKLPGVRSNELANPEGFSAVSNLLAGGTVATLTQASGGGASASRASMTTRPNTISQEARQKAMEVRDSVLANPTEALEKAKALPVSDKSQFGSPRLQALSRVMNLTIRTAPATAAAALDEIIKTIPELEVNGRVIVEIDNAVRGAEMLQDDARTLKALQSGVKIAEKLHALDTDQNDPNRAPKMDWPSTAAWQRFLGQEAKLAPKEVIDDLAAIEDPEIRTAVKIGIARAYFGEEPGRRMWSVQKKRSGSSGNF